MLKVKSEVGSCFPERLCRLRPWRFSRSAWKGALSSQVWSQSRPCFGQGVGVETPTCSFPPERLIDPRLRGTLPNNHQSNAQDHAWQRGQNSISRGDEPFLNVGSTQLRCLEASSQLVEGSNHAYDCDSWILLLPHQLRNMPTNLALGPATAPPIRFSPIELRTCLIKQVSAKPDDSECQNGTSTHENGFTSKPESY